MSDDLMHNLALRFYGRNQSQHLSADRKALIDRCADHVSDTYNVPLPRAQDVALRAFGEFDSRGERCYIDINRSTAYGVFVHDPATGDRRYFTVGDLVALALMKAAQPLSAVAG